MLEYNAHLLSKVQPASEKAYIKALLDAYAIATNKLISTNGVYTQKVLAQTLSEIRAELISINAEFVKELQPNLFEIISADNRALSEELSLSLAYAGINQKISKLPSNIIKEIIDVGTMNFYRIDAKGTSHVTSTTVNQIFAGITNDQYKQIKSVILAESVTGSAPEQIARKLKPFLVDNATVKARTAVRTILAEASQQAAIKTYEDNRDVIEEYIYSAVLDSRTSSICRSLDGRRFDTPKPYYTPPLHPNCRSNLIGVPIGYEVGQRPIVEEDGIVTIVTDKNFTYKDALDKFPSLNNKKLIDVDKYLKDMSYLDK